MSSELVIADEKGRQALSEHLVTELVHSGACFSLSAPNNFGKSYFLRALVEPVRRAGLWPVYIDCNLRAADSAPGFYEVVLRHIIPGAPAEMQERLHNLYCQLTAPATGADQFGPALNFLLAFETILSTLERGKLVLVLDAFDAPHNFLPAPALGHLRALKDRFYHRLSYVVATRFPLLAMARSTEEESAEFYELFNRAIRLPGLQPAELPDIPAGSRLLLYRLTGGHPGLVKLLGPENGRAQRPGEAENDYLERLRTDPMVRLESQRLWQSLHPTEQSALLQWLEGVRGGPAPGGLLGSLPERGLVDESSGQLFALAFEWYVQEQLNEAGANSIDLSGRPRPQPALPHSDSAAGQEQELFYDVQHHQITFEPGGRKLPLTGNAATLFHYLFLRQSIPFCTKDELINAIWGPDMAYSSENLDRLLSDLRQLLNDHNKQIIRTIHRRGLQMVGVKEF